MKARNLGIAGVLFAASAMLLVAVCSGCSGALPAPTVTGSASTETVSATATVVPLGQETTITVNQLKTALTQGGFAVQEPKSHKEGVFLPAKFVPLVVDNSFVQTYQFITPREANFAASTVTTDGATLDAAPNQPVLINWAGRVAFFRSGDLIVIFVGARGDSPAAKRDAKIFDALQATLGAPFMRGAEATPTPHSAATTATL